MGETEYDKGFEAGRISESVIALQKGLEKLLESNEGLKDLLAKSEEERKLTQSNTDNRLSRLEERDKNEVRVLVAILSVVAGLFGYIYRDAVDYFFAHFL